MKKGTKVVIVCACAIGAGVVLGTMGLLLGSRVTGVGINGNGIQVYSPRKISYTEGEEELKAFKDIQIKMDYADFTIEPSNHYGISYRYEDNQEFSYEIRDDKLMVTQSYRNSGYQNNWFIFGGSGGYFGSSQREFVTIYVPEETVLDKVSVRNSSGEVEISSVYIEDLDLKADYGDVVLSGIEGGNMALSLSSGTLQIESLLGKFLTVDNDYGAIEITDVDLSEGSEVKASSGTIELKNVKMPELSVRDDYGDIRGDNVSIDRAELYLSSGDCKMKKFQFDDLRIDSDYGGVRLELIQTIGDYDFDLYTDYGEITISEKDMGDRYATLDEEKDREIKVECSSGDIKISQFK